MNWANICLVREKTFIHRNLKTCNPKGGGGGEWGVWGGVRGGVLEKLESEID